MQEVEDHFDCTICRCTGNVCFVVLFLHCCIYFMWGWNGKTDFDHIGIWKKEEKETNFFPRELITIFIAMCRVEIYIHVEWGMVFESIH